MNTLAIWLISSLSFALILFFIQARNLWKKLTRQIVTYQLQIFQLSSQLSTLRTQYRIVSQIKEVLKGTTKQSKKL